MEKKSNQNIMVNQKKCLNSISIALNRFRLGGIYNLYSANQGITILLCSSKKYLPNIIDNNELHDSVDNAHTRTLYGGGARSRISKK